MSEVARRAFLIATGALLIAPLTTKAQRAAKVARVGVLFASARATVSRTFETFRSELGRYGYLDGKTVVLEPRFGDAKVDRIADAAAELVRMRVDVIVAGTDLGIAAAKRQTDTIPIVMVGSSDPVGTGFVASLARPGTNVTGISALSPELAGKRLELLREVLPAVSRVAVMWTPDVRGAVLDYNESQAAARRLHLDLQSVETTRVEDFERAFSLMKAGRVEAVMVSPLNPLFYTNLDQLVNLIQKERLPSVFGRRDFVDAGGLVSYGTSRTEEWRRAAAYVDKILRGAKPAEMAVEQPTKFELLVNLRTAQTLGLRIPQSLLQRADEVIH